MATCNDCIHSGICKVERQPAPLSDTFTYECECIEKYCSDFKDRSRFVELPCKVGDSIFCLNPNCTFHAVRVDGANVELITSQGFILNQSLIGKTVFLTREEAEQALKEREENA